MKNQPKVIIRISDGEQFILNKNGTYSKKNMIIYKNK